ncbi:MAG: zf-HC2 domain-containing protein [Planctomycetota bacterium]|jgi:predicted anti-sigma-YlaC factor YlaD
MECQQVHKLLSAYYDDELSVEERSSVAEHVQSCPNCGAELVVFQSLSGMAKGLDDPEPPTRIWAGIEAGLDADREGAPIVRPAAERERSPKKWRPSLLATAAVVLIAAGVVWVARTTWHAPGHHGDLAADFGEYLEQFATDPDVAQKVLLAKYNGQAVDLSQAATHLGCRPAVAEGLPERYTLDAVYVLKMPCCTCVQSICRRDDGQVFAIFECDEEHPAWFGDRPRIETQCNGCPCSVIQADRGLVASWKANERQLTVVGARDLEEIGDLVGRLQGGNPDA